MTNAQNRKGQSGASLVEFAVLAPLLFALLFGIVEFGWLFARNVDVGHGAREGVRLAAVAFGTETAIVNETCNRMGLATLSNPSSVFLTIGRSDATGNGSADDVGDIASVTVSSPASTLTGFFDWAIPPSTSLMSTAEIRIEQIPNWTPTTSTCP
jgi:Flp pilus assembly protein TadG